LEVLVDDEEAFLAELNRVYRNDQHVFSGVRIPKRRLPIVTNLVEEQKEVIVEDEQRRANLGSKATVKSKFFSHFIKGKIFLTPMETILVIPGELEYIGRIGQISYKEKGCRRSKNSGSYCPSNPYNLEGEYQQNSPQQNIASSY
jgi:hypothetical protein